MEIWEPKEWEKIVQTPTWYHAVPRVWKNINDLYRKDPASCEREVKRLADFFEEHLEKNNVALASDGGDQDKERQPIDTIVVHHTSMSPGLTKERLSAIDLLRLYAPQFARYRERDRRLIWSGHVRNGRQVFWPYHWIVRTDGAVERLLDDGEIGWHAGNWDVNCRSVAIVTDNDYENAVPSVRELEAIAGIIRSLYSHVHQENIIGHREVNPKTTCPSNLFLPSENHEGWRNDLLKIIFS